LGFSSLNVRKTLKLKNFIFNVFLTLGVSFSESAVVSTVYVLLATSLCGVGVVVESGLKLVPISPLIWMYSLAVSSALSLLK